MTWDYSRHYARFHSDTPEHTTNLHATYHRWLWTHLPLDKSRPILDVGCGRGYALEWLRSLGYTNLVGVDSDRAQVDYARARGLDVELSTDTPAWLRQRAGSCDLVILMDVLEHQPRNEDRRLLEAIHGALRSGGLLLCTVPNAVSPLANYWRHLDYTHHTCFTPESLDYLVSHAGFRLQGVFPAEISTPPFWPPGRQSLRRAMQKLSRLPWRLACLGEFGWEVGRRTPLSPNLLAVAVRDRPCV